MPAPLQAAGPSTAVRAQAYGFPGTVVDGCDTVEVYKASKASVDCVTVSVAKGLGGWSRFTRLRSTPGFTPQNDGFWGKAPSGVGHLSTANEIQLKGRRDCGPIPNRTDEGCQDYRVWNSLIVVVAEQAATEEVNGPFLQLPGTVLFQGDG